MGFNSLIVLVSCLGIYAIFESTLSGFLGPLPLSAVQAAAFHHSLRFSLIWTLVILIAACGLEAYLHFHRIVGPLFALERELKRIAEGDLGNPTHLRKNDELKDIFQTLEITKSALRNRFENRIELLNEIERTLERLSRELPPPRRDEVLNLKERLSQFTHSL